MSKRDGGANVSERLPGDAGESASEKWVHALLKVVDSISGGKGAVAEEGVGHRSAANNRRGFGLVLLHQ
jgi:hypothetical protein